MEEPSQENLWSSILNSVSSSRSIPSKHVLLLGEPSSGKSTLVSALLQRQAESKDGKGDFAIGYDWANVKDEADEDTLARLSVYTVPSSSSTYLSLLPNFIPPSSSLQNTVVMIVLDWTRPASFIEQLKLWFSWVDRWSAGDSSRESVIAAEESRERLQQYWQRYQEPGSDASSSSAALSNIVLPLGPGTLTHNPNGVMIVVVCTKADLIDEGSDSAVGNSSGLGGMVKSKGGEWDERTDTIMQILRTICLKYGAALFYTSLLPQTLVYLRQYILRLLFTPFTPSVGLYNNAETMTPFRNPFPIFQKPSVLDRDRIFIPMGWDSWGKIAFLREGFNFKTWEEAWDLQFCSANEELERDKQYAESANKLYSDLVPDNRQKPHCLSPFNNPVPEQVFLAKNFDENSKKNDKDPRGAFRSPVEGESNASGIVGPLGSSSLNLPSVERALVEMEGTLSDGLSFSDTRKGLRKEITRPANSITAAGQASTPGNHAHSRPPNTSPGSSSSPDLKVLHNFFQSLLVPGGRGGVLSPSSIRTTVDGSETLADGVVDVDNNTSQLS